MAVLVCLSCAASSARAQSTPDPGSATERPAAVSVMAVLLPAGTIHVSGGGDSLSNDTAFAFGLAGTLDYNLTPRVSIGATPQILFNVKGSDATTSAKQLDLLGHITAWYPASPTLRLFGAFSGGYSMLFIPDWPSEISNPAGLVISFDGGAAIKVGPTAFVTVDVGYQKGFQGVSEMGDHLDLDTSFVRLGFGLGTRL